MERAPLLVCVEGALTGHQFPITSEGLRLGREPGNEIVIVDTGVSRQHARVILHNGAVWVQDAGSRNGVFVNDARVPDHKQLKVGDRLRVGATLFEVAMTGPSSRGAAAAAPPPAPPAAAPVPVVAPEPVPETAGSPRWKLWPFLVAVGVVVLVIGWIAVAGKGGSGAKGRAPEVTPPAYSLGSIGNGAPTEAAGSAPSAPATATLEQALAAGAAAKTAVPDPPAGLTATDLKERAQGMMDADRLHEARVAYQQALKLEPGCSLCQVRVEKLGQDIQKKAQERLDAGLRALDSMQYAQAVTALEMVLLLVPSAEEPLNARAQEALRRARAGLGGPAAR
jgi:hypothetical protein